MEQKDRIYGCLLGGWCAEAAGATLEFYKWSEIEHCIENGHAITPTITAAVAENAMHMTGGGVLGVGPGQITDDGEMEISTLYGLFADSLPGNANNVDKVAEEYIKWFKSRPFDVGRTCSHALENATSSGTMMANAARFNPRSESNGALMRSAGIAVYAHINRLNIPEAIYLAEQTALLTHSHPICIDINRAYVICLWEILNISSDVIYKTKDALHHLRQNITNETVKQWFGEATKLTAPPAVDDNEGHVKHAFMLLIYFLTNYHKYPPKTAYEQIIKEILMLGGDTDTNAKIVGNVIGAICGHTKIPLYMRKPVLDFDCTTTQLGYPRPKRYSARRMLKFLKGIIHMQTPH